jgi:chromosome segregation ATPase
MSQNSRLLALVMASLGLCVVTVAQWRREHHFRQRLAEAEATLQSEKAARREVTEKSEALTREITRLTQLRADTEAKLVEVTDALTAARQAEEGVGKAAEERRQLVTAHQAAIAEANARLQRLTAERDEALEELNKRTRAYNELMGRYQKLAK